MENVKEAILDFQGALLSINRIKASEILKEYYNQGKGFKLVEAIINQSLEEIGAGWEEGTVSLSQVYMSGVLCEELLEEYLPKADEKRKVLPRIAVVVLKDQHALGKRIVTSIIRANGYEVMDFGQGVDVETVVKLSLEHQIEVLMISTLMLSSALEVLKVKELFKEKGADIKIVVGGAPFRLDRQLWERVGADAQGIDASDIMNIIEKVVGGKDE